MANQTLSEKLKEHNINEALVIVLKGFISEIKKLAEYLPTKKGTKFMQKVIDNEAGDDLI